MLYGHLRKIKDRVKERRTLIPQDFEDPIEEKRTLIPKGRNMEERQEKLTIKV